MALLWFFYKKSHNYVTAQRIFNWFCQNQTTVSWHIYLRIYTESFAKFVQKLWEIYGKNKYITFFLNTEYSHRGTIIMRIIIIMILAIHRVSTHLQVVCQCTTWPSWYHTYTGADHQDCAAGSCDTTAFDARRTHDLHEIHGRPQCLRPVC